MIQAIFNATWCVILAALMCKAAMLVFERFAPAHLAVQPYIAVAGIAGAFLGVYFYAELSED